MGNSMKNLSKTMNEDNEKGARKQMLEELFEDFHSNRIQIYWMNFTRGIFFGLGTILGGTVLIAVIIWLLGQLVTIPFIGEYISGIIDSLNQSQK
jgi:hypothetical protein